MAPNKNPSKASPSTARRAVNRSADLDDTDGPSADMGPSHLSVIAIRIAIMLVAAAMVHRFELVRHLLQPTELVGPAYWLGIVAGGIWTITVLLILIWKHVIQRGASYRHLRMRARRPLIIIVASGFTALLSLTVAFWPVLGAGGLLLFLFLTYALFCLLSFV